MITMNQLLRRARKGKRKKRIIKARNKLVKPRCYYGGIVKKRMTASPKKPNSAVRKVAKVALSDGNLITVYVPGEVNGLKEHSQVIVRGCRRKDLPGVKKAIVCGAKDAPSISNRGQSRSKYGVSKPKK